MKPQHVIFFDWFMDIRIGGPPGYLANLHTGLSELNDLFLGNIYFLVQKKVAKGKEDHFFVSFIKKYKYLRWFFRNFTASGRKYGLEYNSFLENYSEMCISREMADSIDWERVKTIHVHTVVDCIKAKNFINYRNLSHIKIVLTCHTPEPPSTENYQSMKSLGYNESFASEHKRLMQIIERKAFEYADIFIFPSAEAMEPYFEMIPDFEEWICNKKIHYLLTGAKSLERTVTGGKDKAISICFLGRHNQVKGYDILKNAASRLLEKHPNIYFNIGGRAESGVEPLDHPRWVEHGWVNPNDIFRKSQIFVLPNRSTYFDLILVEAISTGIHIIASNTGGNKTMYREVDGLIDLFDGSAEDLVNKVENAITRLSDGRNQELINIYEEKFTPKAFGQNYLDIVKCILKEI